MKSSPEPGQKTASYLPKRAKVLVQFASLAVMTQVVLLLNQILLLPIQLRVWGTDLTAYWQTSMSIALITSVADLGLRVAGHAELIRHKHDPNDRGAETAFAHIWAWMRILMVVATAVLVGGDFTVQHVLLGHDYPFWRTALLIGAALEVQLCLRVGYLDSLDLYRESEAGYLIFAAGRLFLAVGALLLFHASPAVLAWIWFFTGVAGLAQQSQLCQRVGRLSLFERIPADLSWESLATVRYTLADPLSYWARIHGPVLILSAFAQPFAIVTYAALRAIFGAARTTINQLSRYASVEYVALRHAGRRETAEMHLTMMVLLSTFAASAMAALVVVDNGRLASLILSKMDLPVYMLVVMSVGLGNAFYAFQINMSVCRRLGEVAQIAHRQYFYIGCVALAAVISVAAKSLLACLGLLLLADVLLSLSVMMTPPRDSILRETSSGWRGTIAAAASSVLVLTMWLIMHYENFGFLSGRSFTDIAGTIAFFLGWILLIGLVDLALFYGLRVRNMSLPAALVDWMQKVREAKLQNE